MLERLLLALKPGEYQQHLHTSYSADLGVVLHGVFLCTNHTTLKNHMKSQNSSLFGQFMQLQAGQQTQ
jgi:hypothetical protein